MTSQPLDAFKEDLDPHLTSLKGCAAAQRALDYYLKPSVSSSSSAINDQRFNDSLLVVRDDNDEEEALVHAIQILRSASAAAYDHANTLQGSSRDSALGVTYVINAGTAFVIKAAQKCRPIA